MSVNITSHAYSTTSSQSRNFLMDDERISKAEYEKRKKLRLQQVRQQSKEMAFQARRKAELEKNKLLAEIKKTKTKELNAWRDKVITQKQEEYKSNLNKFGEAHIAAAYEERLQKEKLEREKFGNLSKKRPPLSQYNKQKKFTCNKHLQSVKNNKVNVNSKRPEINDENSSNVANRQKYVISTSSSQQNIYPHVYVRETEADDSSFSSLYNDNEDDYQNKEDESVIEISKRLSQNYQYEIDSEYDLQLQNLDGQEHAKQQFMPPARIRKEGANKDKVDIYDPKDYRATDTSSESALLELPISKSQPFTQISDLIRKRQELSGEKHNMDSNAKPTNNKFQAGFNKKPAVSYMDWQKSSGKVFDILEKSSIFPIAPKTNLTNTGKSQLHSTGDTKKTQPIRRTSPTKISNKQKPVLQPTDRVQYYDYFNRFEKQYNPTDLDVVKNDKSNRLNAMQEARVETQMEVAQQRNLEQLKKKVNERSQRALEKEQTRRDYEELTAKLDALIKQKNVSEIGQQTTNSLNSRVNRQISKNLNRKELYPEEQQPAAQKGGQAVLISSSKNDDIVMNDSNSSDSCASILLNYVNVRSKQVAQDIITCDNTNKLDKLKELLVRINQIRDQLLHEVKKISLQNQEIVVQKVVDAIDIIEKERLKIIEENSQKESLTNEFQKKENDLIRREKILERKLKDLYKKEKEKKNVESEYSSNQSEETVVLEERLVNKPVKIVIQLNENIRRKYPKSPYKSPRKRSSSLSGRSVKLKKTPAISKEILRSAPIEKAIQVSLSSKIHDDRIKSVPDSTSSTSYRSPPNNIQSKLSAYLENSEPKEPFADTVKSKTLQNLDVEKRNKKIQTTTEVKLDKKVEEDRKKGPSNPVLMQYIKRLLGMSRNSIEMLGLSSSEVDTPSASLVNASGNFSTTESEILQQTQIERLNKFINDNYSFLNEMEESILNEKSLSVSNNSSMKTIEAIWKETLRKQEQKMRKEKEEKRQKQLKELRPILKMSNKPKKSLKDTPQQTEDISPSDDKMLLVSKYTELTDNCTQRIAELTEMINKVRKEKQKILEITLSSGTETFRNSTEYMDFADRQANESEGGTQDSSKISDPKPVDSIVRLEKNKLTGMSRDSGISLSRPVTSLDIRDSPDIRYVEKPIEDHQNESAFVPILKDIPKLPPRVAQIDEISTEFCSVVTQNDDAVDKTKKTKPPVSLSRYSPQLVEEIPHELSTIFEVDTPATSRLNASLNDHNLLPSIIEQERIKYNELKGKKFPTFEEYAHQHNLDLTKFDPEASSKYTIENSSVNNSLPEKGNQLEPQQEASDSIIIKEKDGDQVLAYKKFLTCAEYLEKIGVTSILDSRTLEEVSEISENKDTLSVSSTKSIIDVVAEMKRRKIIDNSFDIDSIHTSENPSSEKSPHTESNESDLQVITNDAEQLKSKNKKNVVDHKSDETLKRKLQEQSHSDDFGKDLDKMGLKWASLMLKKSQQQQDKGSSTSSSIGYIPRKWSPKKPMHASKDKLSGIHPIGIYTLYDVPHLFKSLRNTLMTTDIYTTDGIISWEVVRKLYQFDCSENTKICPKLTKKHVEPNTFEKMRVNLATQIFNRSVAAGIATCINSQKFHGELAEKADATCKFISRADKLFDCLNSRCFNDKNIFKAPLMESNTVSVYINEMIDYLGDIRLLKQKRNYCINGLILTINAILKIRDDLVAEDSNITFLLTSRFNQDPVENLFAQIRAKGGNNRNPSVFEFNNSIARIMSMKIITCSYIKNCEDDDDLQLEWNDSASGTNDLLLSTTEQIHADTASILHDAETVTIQLDDISLVM